MKTSVVLGKVFREIVAEAERNSVFAERIRDAFGSVLDSPSDKRSQPKRIVGTSLKRPNRRAPSAFDPFAVGRSEGIPALRGKLAGLTLDQLKDIVSEHAMDGSRLALKWKAPERLIELIVTTVVGRSSKGDAFRESPVGLRDHETR
jgi:hypothetical protein